MREVKISLNDAMPVIEEKLAAGLEVLFSPNGVSMLPTFKAGRDTLVLVSPPERLGRYDVALFRRKNGQCVIHRVVKCGESYTFLGDGQTVLEGDIGREQVVALCSAYIRDGRRVELSSLGCQMYARLWVWSLPLRRLYRWVSSLLGRVYRKIFKK